MKKAPYILNTTYKIRALRQRGLSLIEVVVGVALLSLIFWGLTGVFRMSVVLITTNKANTGAVALALDQMEYIRSLPYFSVGTVGGIPSGTIPQEEEITLNNIDYTRRVFVQYVDAPQDGIGSEDENGLTTDYKVVKVEVQWTLRDLPYEVDLVSTIVPKGIETTEGGGILTINVLSALGLPVEGAEVTIENDTVDPPVELTTYSNIDGIVSFPGTPEGSGYSVAVTKSGYSTAGTYSATADNVDPNPPHLSVIEETLTTATFQIDELAGLALSTFSPPEDLTWTDEFTDTTGLSETSSTTVSSGSLVLASDVNGYLSIGSARSTGVSDDDLGLWDEVTWSHTVPVGTSAVYHVYYDDAGTPTMIPDAVLAGNSTGFTTSPVDISMISTTTYDTLFLSSELETNDQLVTPEVHEWSISYRTKKLPFPQADFAIRGTKTIGTDDDDVPVYKFTDTFATDGFGEYLHDELEWDVYELTLNEPGYAVSEFCPPPPLELDPGESEIASMTISTSTDHTLLVTVADEMGAGIEGASVRVYNNESTDVTLEGTACGSAFLSSITNGEYSVDISAPGYESTTVGGVDVLGVSEVRVILTSS